MSAEWLRFEKYKRMTKFIIRRSDFMINRPGTVPYFKIIGLYKVTSLKIQKMYRNGSVIYIESEMDKTNLPSN